ncbi:cache domain-containing protein, partial [Phaeobacter sp. PT47_59]|uniref:cache domain-containing protein n=1 Tax=Phaeobacter sp. PT47_59 TaxID=3029979 RepID=UPI00237FFE98
MPTFLYRLPARIYALAGLAVVLAAVLTFILLSRAIDNAYEMREKELDSLTDSMVSVLASLEAQVQAGTITLEEAQARGIAAVELPRFGAAGYFFAFNRDNYMVAHPVAKQLLGVDQSEFEDVNGVFVFQEFQRVINEHGKGAVIYHFNKPDSEIPEAKMGYIKLFEPWGWVVGTGAYVADIEADIAAMRNSALIALVVGLAAMGVAAFFIARSVINPVENLKDRMLSMAEGDTASDIPGTESRNEIGDMARTLDVFRNSLIRQKELETAQKERDAAQAQVVHTLTDRLSVLASGDLTVRIDSAFPEDYEQLRLDFNKTVENLNGTVSQVVESAASIRNGA